MKTSRTWWKPLYIKDYRMPQPIIKPILNCKTEADLVAAMKDYRDSSGCTHVVICDSSGTDFGYLYEEDSVMFLNNSPHSSRILYYWYSPWRNI